MLLFYIAQKTHIFQSHNLCFSLTHYFPHSHYVICTCLEENCSVKCSSLHSDLLVVQLLKGL